MKPLQSGLSYVMDLSITDSHCSPVLTTLKNLCLWADKDDYTLTYSIPEYA